MSRQKKCDVVLFWSLDRFSREGSRQTLNYLTKINNIKITLENKFIKEFFDMREQARKLLIQGKNAQAQKLLDTLLNDVTFP